MNKVITINLNGNAYQVDEFGYHALSDYLDQAKAQLGDNPDLEEIVADLEQAIADKCDRFLGPNKNVISTEELQTILEEMGPVETGDTESDASDQETGDTRGEERRERSSRDSGSPKRLYKIEDGKMLDGVCNGLAVYFNIDVTIVRLIFVALAFVSGGIMVVVYLVMMFVIPQARTPEEQAAAFGMPFNAQEVMDQAKAKFDDLKKNGEKWKTKWKAEEGSLRQKGHQLRERMRYKTAEIRDRTRDFGLPMGIAIGIALFFAFAIMMSWNAFFPFGFFTRIGVPPWVRFMLIFGIFWAVAWTLTGARRYDRRGPGPIGFLFGGIAQLVLMIFVLWFAYNMFPFVREFIDRLIVLFYQLVM